MMGAVRAPDAAQRAVLHGVVRCRAGAVTDAGVWYGPGSAKQREERCIAPGTRCGEAPQPPYRYAGSHSVMPGHRYMMTMHTITISM
jgi:hypothetical protein